MRFPVDTDLLVHHKFCLIDADPLTDEPPRRIGCKPSRVLGSNELSSLPANGVLLNGSMNWTMQVSAGANEPSSGQPPPPPSPTCNVLQALSGNWENITITSVPQLMRPFVAEFETMWTDFAGTRFEPPAAETATPVRPHP